MSSNTTDARARICRDCDQAAGRRWHGFTSGCLGCAARAVGRGLNYREAQAEGRQTRKYRGECEQLGVTHQQVLEAVRLDAGQKAATK